MRQLTLVRHGHALNATPGTQDADRALSATGRQEALTTARSLAATKTAPDLLLVSPAVRTQQTAELLQAHAFPGVPVITERPLYLATLAQLLDCLRSLDEAVSSVVLIGHNPGLSELCTHLARDGSTVELDTAEKMAASENGRISASFPSVGRIKYRMAVPRPPIPLANTANHIR